MPENDNGTPPIPLSVAAAVALDQGKADPTPVVVEARRPAWVLTLAPIPGSTEASVSLKAHEPGVTWINLVPYLGKVVSMLASQPNAVIPTEAEVMAEQARQKVIAEHPAVAMYGRASDILWIGAAAQQQHAEALEAAGWRPLGAVPPEVHVPCALTLDPARLAACLAPVDPATPAA